MAGEKRIERLQKQILRILSKKILYEMNDPRLSKLLTLTKVNLTKDMSIAKVYFSIIGTEKERIQAHKVLNKATSHLRHELGQELQIRTLPSLEFIFDESIDGAIRISAKIEELKKEFLPDDTSKPNLEVDDEDED